MDIKKAVERFKQETILFRRDVHRKPELSGKEFETTKKIITELEKYGIEYILPGKTGVIAVIRGRDGGKTIGLRGDIDALPIQEETGLEYKSINSGVMHACGHDVHAAAVLEAAKIINEYKNEFQGTVKIIFQPSEEYLPSGAEMMVASGALSDCSAIIGLHVKSDIETGKISVQPGPRMAASAGIAIKITGKTGHGGNPSNAVDATVAASAVVMNLQTISSRELSLDDMAVISIGTFHSGIAANIISGEAVLSGTCRYYSDRAIKTVSEAIERICKNTAASYRACAEVSVTPTGCEAVINDPALSMLAEKSITELYGEQAITLYPISGLNEDFSKYSATCPTLYMLVGAGNDRLFISEPLHSPKLMLDEDCIDYAVGALVKIAMDYLK